MSSWAASGRDGKRCFVSSRNIAFFVSPFLFGNSVLNRNGAVKRKLYNGGSIVMLSKCYVIATVVFFKIDDYYKIIKP